VAHVQHGLVRDRERRGLQQVVRLGDRPDERALDREDAELDLARDRRRGDGREARQRNDGGRLREEPIARGRGVRAVASGVGDGEAYHRFRLTAIGSSQRVQTRIAAPCRSARSTASGIAQLQ
jgi:hypothetical protein